MNKRIKPGDPYSEIDHDHFWSKVHKTDGCWLWTAGKFSTGYGQCHVRLWPMYAHRISWMISNQRNIPYGLFVLHRCDNPPCVNPDHLFLGTQLDNRRDSVAKGRTAKGERHGTRTKPESVHRGDNHIFRLHPERHARGQNTPRCKLTETIVREIRCKHETGTISCAQLGRDYGVTKQSILALIHRRTWSYI